MPKHFIEINIEQNTPEWLEMRRSKIGASEAATILGVNPYDTPYKLYHRKMSGDEVFQNAAMKKGSDLEERVRDMINELENVPFKKKVFQSESYGFMIASLDGWNGKYHIEIKCPSSYNVHVKALQNTVPDHYMPQLQHQMYVMGTDHCQYVSYFETSETPLSVVNVHRDEEMIRDIIAKESEFYQRMINFDPPTASNLDWIEIDDPTAKEMAIFYSELTETIENAEKERDRIKKQMIELAKHPLCTIGNLKLQKIKREGNIDYSTIPVLKDIDLEQYRKPGFEFWKISQAAS